MRIIPLILVLLLSISTIPAYAQGTFWLSGWDYRVPFTVAANYDDVQANFTLTIPATYYNSVRVTEDDGVTLIPIWNDSLTNIWARFPYANQTYYLYYGNDGAAAVYNATAVFQRVISSGIALSLPMNEGAGATCTDYSGYGNNGTLVNAPTRITGKFDGAVQLDGVNQEITCGTAIDVFSGDWTVSFWADKANLAASKSLWGLWLNVGGSFSYISCEVWNTGQIVPYIFDGAANQNAPIGTYTLPDWNHICYTHVAATKTLTVYIAGSAEGAPVVHTLNLSKLVNSGANTFRIGTYTDFWNGGFDDFQIYSRALSAPEISDLATYYPQCSSSNLGSLYLRRWSDTLSTTFGNTETSATVEANNNLLAIGLLTVAAAFTFVIVMVKRRSQ